MTETIKKGKVRGRHSALPTKRSINLAYIGVERFSMKITIPAIIVIVILAALFSKFGVADRLSAVNAAAGETAAIRSQLNAAYAEIDSYGDLAESYAHYTYAGMTEAELTLADRPEVLDLIEKMILPESAAGAWTLSGNQLTLSVTADTLQDINMLARRLETDSRVNYCTVTEARTNEVQRVVTPEPTPVPETPEGEEPAEGGEPVSEDEEPVGEIIVTETTVTANIIIYLTANGAEDEA